VKWGFAAFVAVALALCAALAGFGSPATSVDAPVASPVLRPDPVIAPVADDARPLVRVPEGPVRRTVLIALHGYTSNPDELRARLDTDAWVHELGATVVYPTGLGARPSWNAGGCCGSAARSGIEDVGYLSRVIGSLQAEGARRIVLVGYSNGGMLAYRMACERPDLAHEIAVINATIAVPECDGTFSALHLAGEVDDAVPVQGADDVPYLFTGFRPLVELPAVARKAQLDVRVLPGVGHEISPQAHGLITEWIAARG
jgi:poly(3-hydroxybutyrate) depolymerase